MTHIEVAFEKRTLVKASAMRRTLFLLPSKHLAVFVRGSARRAEREIRWARGKGVSARDLDAAIDAALGVLDQPLTRPEIAERVCRVLGVRKRMVRGGGWGSQRELAGVPVGALTYPVLDLLHLVGARGVICYGPNYENEPTFVRADAWIPRWQDVIQDQAETLLLRRYLRAFGPATAADFARWAGITLTDAREIWSHAESGLILVNVEGRTGTVLREDVDELMQVEFEHPSIRLLPHFDSFILGHKDRDHLAAREHQAKIYRPQGWVAPVVLIDGQVIAVWGYLLDKDRLRVTVAKFSSLSQQISASILEEVQSLAQFLGAKDMDMQIL